LIGSDYQYHKEDAFMPIINGRRIQEPPGGMSGRTLIREVAPAPGRRPVIRKGGVAFEAVDPYHHYTTSELYDKQGKPVKVTTIPDRTKGLVTFGAPRTPVSQQLITSQVFDIAEHLFKRNILFDEDNADWVIIPQYRLPPIWHGVARVSDLLIVFPTNYPSFPPIGFYLQADLPLSANGHLYESAYHQACKDPLEMGWKWYCVYINEGCWQPARIRYLDDWKKGDNLWTYFSLISEVLSGMED
jgi:hypothetical protein